MRYRLLLFVASLCVVLAGCASSSEEPVAAAETATPEPIQTPTPEPPAELSWEDVVDKLTPSTVMVRADFPTTPIEFEFQGMGTGIVFTDDGYIVTNAHVVNGAGAVTVAPAGSNRERSARIVGVSPCDDLAVLKIDDMDDLEPAEFGDLADERVGSEVAAVGYPLSFLLSADVSMTRGVISRLDEPVAPHERMVQHDASLNPGNSGGPLVNRKGEVIGINTMGFEPSVASNVNFAIRIDHAQRIIDELQPGKHRHWIGMNLAHNFYGDYFGTEDGMVVSAVASGSSASSIGVRAPYLLTSIEDLSVSSMEDVCRILRSHQDGDSLAVEFLHITDTEFQFLEGEVVMGNESGGSELEIYFRQSFIEEDTTGSSGTNGTNGTANGGDGDEVLTIGSWSGIAEIEIEYWTPCGPGGDWEQYYEDLIVYDVYVYVDAPLEGELNPYYIEIWSEPIDEEGAFQIFSSHVIDDSIVEYWAVDYEGTIVSGELVYTGEDILAVGNVIAGWDPEDHCDADTDFVFLDLAMSAGTAFYGQLGETEGWMMIAGGVTTGVRDYVIYLELVRD